MPTTTAILKGQPHHTATDANGVVLGEAWPVHLPTGTFTLTVFGRWVGQMTEAEALATLDVLPVTGYRTNADNTQTLAWLPRESDGLVECAHAAPACCVECFEADGRLFRNVLGDVVANIPLDRYLDRATRTLIPVAHKAPGRV